MPVRRCIIRYMRKTPFKLPKAILSQLNEFSKGFYLVTLNEAGNFDTYINYPEHATELAFMNFLDIQSNTFQEIVRLKSIEQKLKQEMGEDETDETAN